MRGLLWLLGLFALAAILAVAGRYNEGYALLVWPPYRIQISLNLLIVLLVGGFAAIYALTRLVARTMALPRAVQRYRQRVGRERAAQAIYDAVRLRIEGRFGQALKQATAAYEAGESRGLAALLAAVLPGPWGYAVVYAALLYPPCLWVGVHIGPTLIARYDSELLRPPAGAEPGLQQAAPLGAAQQRVWAALQSWCLAGTGDGRAPFWQPWRLPDMAERLGVPFADMVFVDDQMTNIRGAEALGITSVPFDPRDPESAYAATRAHLGLAAAAL